jgi:hypothetical protein
MRRAEEPVMSFSERCLSSRGPAGLLAALVLALIASPVVTAVAPATAARTLKGLADLERQFVTPPPEARVMVRWWWFGPAVTTDELDREMRAMRDGGIGGFEVQPVYPLTLDDPAHGLRNLPFLSAEFGTALRFAAGRARELGLRMDVTMGSGWPYGGAQVGVDQAAGKLRVEHVAVRSGELRVPLPDVGAGERLIGAFLVEPPRILEVRDIADGVLRVPPPSEPAANGPREVLVFVSSRTGMMVRRPALNAEGFVLNHYDRAAVGHYLSTVGQPLLDAVGPNRPYAMFCDSLEVDDSDWTPDFLAEFQQRRGYDLRPHLPALALGGPDSAALRHDWGQTLSELLDTEFLAPIAAWARERGTRFRVQAYGIPPATIWSNSVTDLPEGEGTQWRGMSAARWAASAGHVFGRPVVSSETWTWLHSPSFAASPVDVKAEADVHFLQGINQLVGHGWPYSPDAAGYPGWRFYAAAVLSDKNPWWIVMPDITTYLQRVSFLLRQGTPVTDVAVYLPIDDAWAAFEPGRVGDLIDALDARLGPDAIGSILDAGFNVDFVDGEVVRRMARVDGSTLAIGGGRYRAIVLPALERISPDTLALLDQFAQTGGVVIAARRVPDRSPGYLDAVTKDASVRDLVRRMFEAADAPGVFVADNRQVGATIAARLVPDVRMWPTTSGVGVAHRQLEEADVYFVVNTSNTRQATAATFRSVHRTVQAWNPLTGTVSALAARIDPQGGTTVSLDLSPYESVVLVLGDGPAAAPVQPSRPRRPAAAPRTLDLGAGWQVTFRAPHGAPANAPRTMDHLQSWTDDPETRFFSGVATYEKTVDLPSSLLMPGDTVWLDFGDARAVAPDPPPARRRAWLEAPVREAAVVSVNGVRAGSVWCPPYRVDVTALLRAGRNVFRVDVANLALNYMAGHALPDYRLLDLRYGTRFEAQDMDKVRPVTAGLVGTVTLVSRAGPAGAGR